MNQWDKQHKQDIDAAFERIDVPDSLFTFAKEIPLRPESEFSKSSREIETPILYGRKKFGMRLKQIAIASVATFALSVSIGSAVSPTFADYIKTLFDRPSLDPGIQSAAKQGYSQETQSSVTDQGITYKVKEVLADSNRLIFTYSIENEKGETIDPLSMFEKEKLGKDDYFQKGRDSFKVIDENGNEVSTSMDYRLSSGRYVTQSFKKIIPHAPYADMTFSLNENLVGKNLFVSIDLYEINSVKGNWKLKVPVDLEKSIASTKALPIEKDFTTPEGLRVELQKVIYSPTATSLDIQSEWTKKGKEKMNNQHELLMPPGDMYSYHGLHYQIADEQGQVVGMSRPFNDVDPKLAPVSSRQEDDLKTGSKTIWHHSYAPFGQNKKLFFVLKGVGRTEYPNVKEVINPNNLKAKPVVMKYKGTSYTFKDFTYDKQKQEATLAVEEIVYGMGGSLVITDQKGKEYKPDYQSSKGYWKEIDKDKGFYNFSSELVFKGVTEAPEQLTVTLTTTGIYYDQDDWKVEIPQL